MTLRLDDIDDIELQKDIITLVDEHKEAGPVIEKLIQYYTLKLNLGENKKRKLAPHQEQDNDDAGQPSTKIPDLSFQLPARKKYTLVFTRSKLQLLNEKTQTVEHVLSVSDLSQVTCVPTPEKPAGSFTFALFSKHETTDPFVFSLADKGALTILRPGEQALTSPLTSPEDKKKALVDLLKTVCNDVALPSREFYTCSGVSPSTGKADPDRAFVKTYLRTKDGVLYFLPQGILFGFKKPTVFIPKASIAATVITNVTTHTFELGLQLHPDRLPLGAGSTSWAPFQQEDTILLPFSMIEQTDYAGIEGYIQKLGINDQSMTEATKAPEPTNKNNKYSTDDDATTEHQEQPDLEDEEDDEDFAPDDGSDDENPLEYDSDASADNEQDNRGGDDLDDEVDLLDDDDEDEW